MNGDDIPRKFCFDFNKFRNINQWNLEEFILEEGVKLGFHAEDGGDWTDKALWTAPLPIPHRFFECEIPSSILQPLLPNKWEYWEGTIETFSCAGINGTTQLNIQDQSGFSKTVNSNMKIPSYWFENEVLLQIAEEDPSVMVPLEQIELENELVQDVTSTPLGEDWLSVATSSAYNRTGKELQSNLHLFNYTPAFGPSNFPTFYLTAPQQKGMRFCMTMNGGMQILAGKSTSFHTDMFPIPIYDNERTDMGQYIRDIVSILNYKVQISFRPLVLSNN
jgi:hypothetical protein